MEKVGQSTYTSNKNMTVPCKLPLQKYICQSVAASKSTSAGCNFLLRFIVQNNNKEMTTSNENTYLNMGASTLFSKKVFTNYRKIEKVADIHVHVLYVHKKSHRKTTIFLVCVKRTKNVL